MYNIVLATLTHSRHVIYVIVQYFHNIIVMIACLEELGRIELPEQILISITGSSFIP